MVNLQHLCVSRLGSEQPGIRRSVFKGRFVVRRAVTVDYVLGEQTLLAVTLQFVILCFIWDVKRSEGRLLQQIYRVNQA